MPMPKEVTHLQIEDKIEMMIQKNGHKFIFEEFKRYRMICGKTPKVSIAIINYNGQRWLKDCLQSLKNLEYPDKEIFFIDQKSDDDSIAFVQQKFPDIKIIKNRNTGYSGGANKAYEISTGEYLMILNPDTTFQKNYLSILVERMEKDRDIGAITGKIFKMGGNIFDTTGLIAFKNRRVVDRGQGFEDNGQFDTAEQVFGISGCIALYRRKALLDIQVCDEIWDNDFFSYKEDIDVAWRLNLRGWKCFYEPEAMAYHQRGTEILKHYNNKSILAHRKNVPKMAKFYSYRNQRLMQVKNEIFDDLSKDLPRLFLRELLSFGYILLFEPKTVLAFFSFLKLLPKMLKKRKIIQKRKKTTSMSTFFQGKATDVFQQWGRTNKKINA